MKEHIKQQAREAARGFSYKKLHQRLNHENPVLRDAAAYELERRDGIVHLQNTHIEIISELEPLDPATLIRNAVMIEVRVSTCVMDYLSQVPYTYQAQWYNDECIAFSYDCPDTFSEDELKEWLDYMRDEDAVEEEPVKAVLVGNRIIIYDIPHEHLINNSNTYQVSFAQSPSAGNRQ